MTEMNQEPNQGPSQQPAPTQQGDGQTAQSQPSAQPATDQQQNQQQAEQQPSAKPKMSNRKRRIAMVALICIFLLIGLIWLIYWLIWGRFEEFTDDAYVNGNIVQLMPQVTGTVIEVTTDDTRLVQAGQVIIKLDPSDNQVALERAEATLASTVRQVRQNFENAQQAEAALIVRQADLMRAQLDLQRRVGLVGEKAISREEMQHYMTAEQTAQAQYDVALHNLRALMALVENAHIYTHPAVERAKANYKTAYLNLQRTTIVAPVTGYVAKRTVQVGQQVNMSSPMLAIIPLNQIWVDANFKESQLNKIRVGQPVDVTADAYSDFAYHGKVLGLNAGTGAAFALLPAQNATGNWIKIVQRLPVRIGFDPNELQHHPLQIGLSMRVTIDTHDLKGSGLAPANAKGKSFSTSVYADQLAHANALIAQILQDNSPNMYLPPLKLPAGKSA